MYLSLWLACTEYQFDEQKEPFKGLESVPKESVPQKPSQDSEPCEDGYFASYYNLPVNHPDIEQPQDRVGPLDTPWSFDWWDESYFAFRQVDPGLVWGAPWWPVDEGMPGDPQYYAVHWEAWLEVNQDQTVQFELGSDDDSWAVIDDVVVAALPGLHAVEAIPFGVSLTAGLHKLDLYMADRHTSNAGFWFVWLSEDVRIYSCD